MRGSPVGGRKADTRCAGGGPKGGDGPKDTGGGPGGGPGGAPAPAVATGGSGGAGGKAPGNTEPVSGGVSEGGGGKSAGTSLGWRFHPAIGSKGGRGPLPVPEVRKGEEIAAKPRVRAADVLRWERMTHARTRRGEETWEGRGEAAATEGSVAAVLAVSAVFGVATGVGEETGKMRESFNKSVHNWAFL